MLIFTFESNAGPEGARIRWESKLASVQEAQVEAVRTLGELLRDDGPGFWISREARMTVFSGRGEALFEVVVSAVASPAVTVIAQNEPREDPGACRKALWEMREIAAAAALQDSPMTDQEALRTLSAIAAWVQSEAPTDSAACGTVIDLLVDLTSGVDIDALDDARALRLFRRVEKSLSV